MRGEGHRWCPDLDPIPDPPAWTDGNAHDPGVTLLSLLVYALDALPHRAHPHVNGAAAGTPPGSGVVGGLAVPRCDEGALSRVVVSPGMAFGVDGRAIDRDFTSALRHVPQH